MSELDKLLEELDVLKDARKKKSASKIDIFKSMERLRDFQQRKAVLKEGDFVVRNKEGIKRYRLPEKEDVAMVVEVFAHPDVATDAQVTHGIIGVFHADEDVVTTHAIDFRYYEPIKNQT